MGYGMMCGRGGLVFEAVISLVVDRFFIRVVKLELRAVERVINVIKINTNTLL